MTDSHDASDDEIQQLAAAGHKIEATKRYRERNGAGLAEAKQAVEALTWGEDPLSRPSSGAVDADLEKDLVDLLLQGK